MESTINVYMQKIEGMTEYYVFLDLLKGEDIECPALSNPSGFNYSKADHVYSCDWVDSQIKIEEFDMSLANDIAFEDDLLEYDINCAILSASANNMSVYEFIKEVDLDDSFIPSRDAHMPQI